MSPTSRGPVPLGRHCSVRRRGASTTGYLQGDQESKSVPRQGSRIAQPAISLVRPPRLLAKYDAEWQTGRMEPTEQDRRNAAARQIIAERERRVYGEVL